MKLTTINLKLLPSRRFPINIPAPAGAALAIFAVLAIIGLGGRLRSVPSVAAQPTASLPIILIATAQAQPLPTAAPAAQVADVSRANVLPRAVVAYGYPDGNVIGAIEAGRPYRVVAASAGALWLQADVTGSGLIWIRSAELYGVDVELPTPAIVVQPQVVYVAQQGPQEATPAPLAPVAPVYAAQPQKPATAVPVTQPAAPQAVYPTTAPMEQNDVTREWSRQEWAAEHP